MAITELVVTGPAGAAGTNGAGYGGTSTTSLTIGTGSQAIVTQAGLAYVVGASRIRLASDDGAKFMDGIVTAYSGTALTFLCDAYLGSGMHADWNLSITGPAYGGSAALAFNFNNSAWGTQRNAANSAYLSLPYIDAGDVLRVSQPLYAVAGRPAAGATYTDAYFTFQPLSPVSGDRLIYLAGPSVTGTLSCEFAASPTGIFTFAVYNNSNASGSHARQELRTIGGSAGDPYTYYNVNGAGAWSVGARNSDNDRFEVCNASVLGSAVRLAIDGTNFGFNGLSVGAGVGVLFIANAGTVPSTNPTGGGILYTEGGALKFRGSSGTITTVGAA